MRILAASFCLLIAMLGSGCASVQVERAKDVSTAGIAYSKAVSAVIDLDMDALIDASSKRRVALARGPGDEAARTTSLKAADDELIQVVVELAKLKRSVSAVEAYFSGLQALAGETPGDAAEASVKSLVDRVNGVSTALGGEARLSNERKTAIAGLANLVVKQVHGAAIGRALERDAVTIGRALALHEHLLLTSASDIDASTQIDTSAFYRDRLLKPYVAGGIGASWIADRRTYIKGAALGSVSAALKTASDAAVQMGDVWRHILSGKTSTAELMLILQEISAALDNVEALKKAF